MRVKIDDEYFLDAPELQKRLKIGYRKALAILQEIGRRAGRGYVASETVLKEYLKQSPDLKPADKAKARK